MKWKALIVVAVFLGSMLVARAVNPMTFKEISMLVRNGEQPQYILNEATKRKLLKPLSVQEESDLGSDGATPALIKALRAPSIIATAETVDAYKAQLQLQQQNRLAEQREELRARQAAAQAAVAAQAQAQPAADQPPPSRPSANPLIGKPFDLKFTAVDGSTVDVANMRGKVVLVDFWATWCGPCMREMPNVVAAYQKYHGRGFEVVGVSLDKSKASLLSVTQQQGMVWPQYFDGQGWKNALSSSFGIKAIPSMWLVNKKGLLVTTEAWGNLDTLVAKLLEE